jgi:predicted AAA+ superfamily ATPase
MVRRICKPLKSNSFFLFGARGTGKSTFVAEHFSTDIVWTIDLLDEDLFDRYSRKPAALESDWLELDEKPDWIFIDEIQKIPALLNHVHRMIEKQKQNFILTGSSARKLKVVGANLLAGRAFLNYFFPLTFLEWENQLSLSEVLHWGSLPKILQLDTEQRAGFLRSYVNLYMKEEILLEHFVKNLEPFRIFLEVAAQCNGKIVNFSTIAREAQIDDKTVKNYYSLLEDTLLGFYLPAYHKSIRKGQAGHPKFYFFDLGVKRAIERSLQDRFSEGSFAYGDAFEHLVIAEVFRLNSYLAGDFRLSYFRTKEGKEIDLILSRGRKTIVIEIKSRSKVDESEVRVLKNLGHELKANEFYYLSNDPFSTNIAGVHCLPWQKGLQRIFNSSD